MKHACILLLFFAIFSASFGQKKSSVTSPNGRIVFDLQINSSIVFYSVKLDGRLLVQPSRLDLQLSGSSGNNTIQVGKAAHRNATEDYTLLFGKRKQVHARYHEMVVSINSRNTLYNIVVRAFDDGVAFRYELKSGNGDSFQLLDELTQFRLKGNPVARTLLLPSFTSSHEGLYTKHAFENLPTDTLIDMPALFEWSNGTCLAITEAALLDYAGMYLINKKDGLRGVLSPLPKTPLLKVIAKYPHQSPWRVLMIGDSIGTLISSDIVTNLNAPSVLKETDWIRSGKTTFPWWNGTIISDTSFVHGNNFNSNKYYIDFCAANNIKYQHVFQFTGNSIMELGINDAG
ncbi:MAG: glycoside hydrolase family 97 protein, partial [Chitinophagaceae bacterium]